MQVRVLYLGMLRELAGCEREVVQLRHEASLAELYADLQRRLPKLQDFRGAIALAVNYEYSTGSTILRDNDEVALIPPVSGGSGDEPAKTKLPLTSPHASLVGDPIDAVVLIGLCRKLRIDHGRPQFSGADRSSFASRALTGVPRLPHAVRM